ncbi:MAG: hypothetical protein EDX89_19490 [Acidobacteria bacterium]|nr:MAG: hypothetical protein EDX89_19490 [Acidobacteriota bacterium]
MARTFKLALFLVALVGLSLLAMTLATPRDEAEPSGPSLADEPLAARGDTVFATDARARRADAEVPAGAAEAEEADGDEDGCDTPDCAPTQRVRPRPAGGGATGGVTLREDGGDSGWAGQDGPAVSRRGRRPGEGEAGRSALNPDRPYRPEWDSSQAPGYSMPYPPPGVQWREGENVAYPPGSGTQSAPGQPPMVPGMGGSRPAPPPGSGYVPGTQGRYPRGG